MIVSTTGASRPQYKQALSVESTVSVDTDLHYLDVEAEGHKFRRRRRVTILAIAAIFLTAGGILIFSVVHDLRSRPEVNLTDFTCAESDEDCMQSLCPPVGYDWDSEGEFCVLKKGYTCCSVRIFRTDFFNHTCYVPGEDTNSPCLLHAGVAPSTYKQLCRPGYLWIEWRKKCLRKD